MEGKFAEKEYEIQYYEIDYKKRLLLTSLMNYLGDIATRQSDQLGVGLDYLKQNGIAWVLYKWSINIHKYPMYGEKIKIITRPHSFRKFYANRIFEMRDSEGNLIAEADSVWFLIDIEKRKPIRIEEDICNIYGLSQNSTKQLHIEKLKAPVKVDVEKSFYVRYSDIDTNKHVNNVKYVEWVIETIPLEIVTNYTMKSINITYEKETTYGDKIKVFTEIIKSDDKIICNHKIESEEGKELTLLKTLWE